MSPASLQASSTTNTEVRNIDAALHQPGAMSRQPGAISPTATLGLIEWLSGDECHALDEPGLVSGLGRRLQALGLPIDRLTLHLMTLHPEIIGRTIAGAPGEPVQIHERDHSAVAPFIKSALHEAVVTRQTIIAGRGDTYGGWDHLDVFIGRGLIELMIVPLCNADGPVSLATFGTTRPGGFAPGELLALERIVPALRNSCELRTLRQTELSLLDTYIGPMTTQRILAGHIRKDEVETIEAALMLCDLRGFTELSNRLPSERVLQLLNTYFDAVVPAIVREGGEVLKFMGDAVLAFFPGFDAPRCCDAARDAATAILNSMDGLQISDVPLQAGIALHYGKVSYGNIGSGRRLDFTVIGPDVNLLSRIQGVCSENGDTLLMSGQFAEMLTRPDAVSIGEHALKGFLGKIELFTPALPAP
jgi:adenylate cyclase